jgi:hypothetical protein
MLEKISAAEMREEPVRFIYDQLIEADTFSFFS